MQLMLFWLSLEVLSRRFLTKDSMQSSRRVAAPPCERCKRIILIRAAIMMVRPSRASRLMRYRRASQSFQIPCGQMPWVALRHLAAAIADPVFGGKGKVGGFIDAVNTGMMGAVKSSLKLIQQKSTNTPKRLFQERRKAWKPPGEYR